MTLESMVYSVQKYEQRENVYMHLAITIVSFLSLLLLMMPATTTGIISTAILFILGAILLCWKKPQFQKKSGTGFLLAVSAICIVFFGYCFYVRWLPSSKVSSIAALLRLPVSVLVPVTAACLTLCSYPIFFIFHQKTLELLAKAEKHPLVHDLLCCFLSAIVAVILSQLMINVDILYMGIFKFLVGCLIVVVVILLLYCLLGNIRVSVTLGTGLFLILSVINVYVYQFRNRLFEPVDIFSVGTAMNVAENYSLFPIPTSIILGCIFWCSFLTFIFYACAKTKHPLFWKTRLVLLACCVISIFSIYAYTANLSTYHWRKQAAKGNGYILDFVAKIKEAYITEPDDYNLNYISELSDRYASVADSPEKLPHIIVIMNESFSDLSVLGEISTNQEVTPFISSLNENVISGHALASIYGGNTANSEYEFLTGNSMVWMSPNTVPYQQYVRSPAYSMVSYLKENYNYHCVAMHPYLASGWNRPSTYTNLGFDEFFFDEGFPQENIIREYISDQEMFETIIETYEAKTDEPLFLFGVSMQNHGDYAYNEDDFTPSISLVGHEGEHAEAEQYLSLIHETDKAVEYLLSYFSNADEDVVIVFFGDHQPKLDEKFYAAIRSNDSDSLNMLQDYYEVPFFIWTNYDIEEQYIDCTSLNYLSTYMYEAAGIPLPPYNQFLAEMEEIIPVINANGFYSKNSKSYLSLDAASEEEQLWLDAYEQLQYNNVFDNTNRNKNLFPILG